MLVVTETEKLMSFLCWRLRKISCDESITANRTQKHNIRKKVEIRYKKLLIFKREEFLHSNTIDIFSVSSFADIDKVMNLHKTIWGLEDLEITPSHIYTATNHAGGCTLIASDNDIPVGYLYGFPGVDANHEPYFYIHNIGVLQKYRSLGIGMHLMLELRKLLINEGYCLVKWTYDPLETLNASLYIGKLGGITNDYVEDYYGEMNDDINKGIPSDRLNIYWHIRSTHVVDKLKRINQKRSVVFDGRYCINAIGEDDCPIDIPVAYNKQRYYLQSPANYHFLKQKTENTVCKWRMNLRKHMQKAFAEGLYITDTIYTQKKFFYLLSQSPLNN